jgi:glycosyltransferase involved in cell wall biosynthesis
VRLVLIGPVYPYRGGIAHYTTMLSRALREQKRDVLLVSFKRQYPDRLFPGESDKDPSGQPLQADGAQYWIDSLNPITWLTTFGRIYRYRPDVIVLPWWTTFWSPAWFVLGALNRLLLHKPLVYICHNVLPHEARWWDPKLARLVLRLGDRFIVQSAVERQRLLGLVADAAVAVMPHPVYDMFADLRIPREKARRRLELPLEASILLFFGIVREYKGLGDVLAALPEVQARLGQVILVVAGEFWDDKRPYLETIERLGIVGSVLIEDHYISNEDVPLYFSAADVLVAPYRQATGSGVVQMARGLGLPVITTDVAVEESGAVVDGETGFVVRSNDPQSLADAILQFFQTDCRVRSSKRVAHSDEQFSWQRVAELIAGDSGTESWLRGQARY